MFVLVGWIGLKATTIYNKNFAFFKFFSAYISVKELFFNISLGSFASIRRTILLTVSISIPISKATVYTQLNYLSMYLR